MKRVFEKHKGVVCLYILSRILFRDFRILVYYGSFVIWAFLIGLLVAKFLIS